MKKLILFLLLFSVNAYSWTDDFNRTDANPIGGNWSTQSGSDGDLRIVSNTVRGQSSSGSYQAYWNANTPDNAQYSQIKIVSGTTAAVAVRMSTSASTYYMLYQPNAYNLILYKVTGGSYDQKESYGMTEIVGGDVIKLTASNDTLRSYYNGTLIGTYKDATSPINSGMVGLRLRESAVCDDWEGGNLVTCTPSTITRHATIIDTVGNVGRFGHATANAYDSINLIGSWPDSSVMLAKLTKDTVSYHWKIKSAKAGYQIRAYSCAGANTADAYDTITVVGWTGTYTSPVVDTVDVAATHSPSSVVAADSFTFSNLPSGATGSKTTGVISWTPTSVVSKTGVKIIAWYKQTKSDSTYDTISSTFGIVYADSVAPDSASYLDTVKFYGRAFGNTQGSSTITVGDSTPTITSWTNKLIKILLPKLDVGLVDFIIGDGVTSDTILNGLYVKGSSGPTITTQPQSLTRYVGQTATFSVAATGTGTLGYQWKLGGSNITGATGTSYTTVALVSGDNGGSYTCAVTDDNGTTTSSAAVLTVKPWTVTVTDFPVRTIYQRKQSNGIPGGTSRKIVFTGKDSSANQSTYLQAQIKHLAGDVVTDWTTIKTNPTDGAYTCTLTVPMGCWYTGSVRLSDGTVAAQTNRWGIGDVWVIAGQSNAAGYGSIVPERDTASDSSSNGTNGTWTSTRYIDPCRVSYGASMAPQFIRRMVDTYKMPIGIINVAVGSTGLWEPSPTTSNWDYRGNTDHFDSTNGAYPRSVNYIRQAVGVDSNFIGMIWYQGENDAGRSVTKANYKAQFDTLHRWFKEDVGYGTMPMFICQIARMDGIPNDDLQVIQDAHYELEDFTKQRYMVAACWGYGQKVDLIHVDWYGQDTLGQVAARRVIKWFDGSIQPYPVITGVGTTTLRGVSLTTTGTASSSATALSAAKIFVDGVEKRIVSATGEGSSFRINTSDTLKGTNGRLIYGFGNMPNINNVNTDANGLFFPQRYDTLSFTPYAGASQDSIGGLPINDLELCFPFGAWAQGNGKSSFTTGTMPSYPQGAYQPHSIATPATYGYNNAGYFQSSDTGVLKTNYRFNFTNTSAQTICIRWKNQLQDAWFAFCNAGGGFYVSAQYYHTERNIYWTISGATTAYAGSAAGSIPNAQEDHWIFLRKNADSLDIWLDSAKLSTVAFYKKYEIGDLNFSTGNYGQGYPLYIGGWNAATTKSPTRIYDYLMYNKALSEDDIKRVARLPNSLNLYGYSTGNIMDLRASKKSASSGGGSGVTPVNSLRLGL